MPIYPMAQVIQHGNRILVSSLSFAGGRRPNGWFQHLPLDASDEELAAAVMGALERSKIEDLKDLPKPSSRINSLVGEELGFDTTGAMEAATTLVGLTLIGGEVLVKPFQSKAGKGRLGRPELPPAQGIEHVAARVRDALAESARLSAKVVDHEAIAARQSTTGTADAGEDPRARARVGEIPNLSQAVLTRYEGRWAVESVSALRAAPWEMPNGWVQVVPGDDQAPLAAAVVEALTRSVQDLSNAVQDRAATVVDALGVASLEELTGPGTVRIAVLAFTSTGEISLLPQELDAEAGWWVTPENPETRSVGIADPLALWADTIEGMADDLSAAATD